MQETRIIIPPTGMEEIIAKMDDPNTKNTHIKTSTKTAPNKVMESNNPNEKNEDVFLLKYLVQLFDLFLLYPKQENIIIDQYHIFFQLLQ